MHCNLLRFKLLNTIVMKYKYLLLAVLFLSFCGFGFAQTPEGAEVNKPKFVLVNPDIYPIGTTRVLHNFYFFADSNCEDFIDIVTQGSEVKVLQTEFQYFATTKGQITKVLHDYSNVGYKEGDVFDIFLWCGDNTYLVNYKGEITYMSFRPDFVSKTISPGYYDFTDEFEGVIIDSYQDLTAKFQVKLSDGRIGWIKYDNRGLYDGIYNHFTF